MSYEQNTDFIKKLNFFYFFKIWFYDEKSIPRHEKRVPGPARTLPDPEKLGKPSENPEKRERSEILGRRHQAGGLFQYFEKQCWIEISFRNSKSPWKTTSTQWVKP